MNLVPESKKKGHYDYDELRYRNKLGEDLALEGLQNYLRQSDSNLNILSNYMKICRVKTVMEPYVKAMIAG